jgi:hypothetical protein
MKNIFLLIPILAACHTKSLDHYNLNSWEGEWKSTDSTGSFIETWSRINDTLYIGRGLMIANKDTLFNEEIKLVFNRNTVQYLVKAAGQNDDEIVPFAMTQFSKDSWVFENPKHDFPKRITYFLKSTDSLIATVEGIQDTIPRSFTLRFKRN